MMWPFHRHRWVEVGREALWCAAHEELTLAGLQEVPPSPRTLITERCVDQHCRKWRQKTLMGHLPGAKEGAADEVVQQL